MKSSKLIRAGPPALYQLETIKTIIKSQHDGIPGLERCTVGERDRSKPNKTILLVGETGTGKSTLINAMVNYVMGVEWEDKVWFEIVEDRKNKQTLSQTADVTVYEIFGFESDRVGYSLTFIDTPGYGSSLNDSQITNMLCDLFNSTNVINTIDAVCLVMSATEVRLHDKLKYNLQLINSLFSKHMKDHIVALLTHSHGMPAKNALRALEYSTFQCAKTETNEPVHFLFNNSPDFTITEQTKFALHLAWTVTKTGMEEFSGFLNGAAPQNVKNMAAVLQEHVDLSSSIAKLQDRVKLIESKQKEKQQVQKALQESREGMSQNQNHSQEEEKNVTEKVQITRCCPIKAINCTACEKTCQDYDIRYVLFSSCTTNCRYCSCDSGKHEKDSFRYEITTKVVTNIDQDMKQQYEKHQMEEKTNSEKLFNLEEELRGFEDKDGWMEAYGHVVKLEDISLNTNFLSSYRPLDFLIEVMKETGEMEKVQRLEDIKRRKGQEEKLLIDL